MSSYALYRLQGQLQKMGHDAVRPSGNLTSSTQLALAREYANTWSPYCDPHGKGFDAAECLDVLTAPPKQSWEGMMTNAVNAERTQKKSGGISPWLFVGGAAAVVAWFMLK